MTRFILLTLLPFFIQCQSSSSVVGSEHYQSSNVVVKRYGMPKMAFHEELKPYFLEFVEERKETQGGLHLFAGLRKLKLVPSFKNKNIVASCHSFQLLKRDNIEDNLLSLSKGWVELKLLASQYSPKEVKNEALLKKRFRDVFSHCFKEYEEIVGVEIKTDDKSAYEFGMK